MNKTGLHDVLSPHQQARCYTASEGPEETKNTLII